MKGFVTVHRVCLYDRVANIAQIESAAFYFGYIKISNSSASESIIIIVIIIIIITNTIIGGASSCILP